MVWPFLPLIGMHEHYKRTRKKCPNCNGSGWINTGKGGLFGRHQCPRCRGLGILNEKKERMK